MPNRLSRSTSRPPMVADARSLTGASHADEGLSTKLPRRTEKTWKTGLARDYEVERKRSEIKEMRRRGKP